MTGLYAGALGLVYFALSVRTLRLRRRLGIGIGDGGNPVMIRAMRVHANFAEYVPISLLLVFMLELSGTHPAVVHALGGSLLTGRCIHAWGVSRVHEDYRFRVLGMTLTFLALTGASAGLILAALAG